MAAGSVPDTIVRAFVDERIRVIASLLLLDELERVLRRRDFDAYGDENEPH